MGRNNDILVLLKEVEYDLEMPQSHTTDQPIARWGRETEY